LDGKSERAVEAWQVIRSDAFGLPLPESDAGDPLAALDFVVQGDGVAADVKPAR
jgi:hypothetical protein